MATEVDAQPTLLDGEDVAGADLRRELLGGLYPSAGIVSGLSAQALPTPDMRVRLPAGQCLVDDGAGGFVPLSLLTQTDLDIAASNATLPRYDSVIGEVVDTGVEATLIKRFRVITGTPESSPSAPALPPSDQPTAKTLRIANVYVQASAETNGNVRSQDVTVVAAKTSTVPRPTQSLQVTNLDNPSPVAGAWTDFTSGIWPPITFTVPPSGMAYVTVGAECYTDTGTISTARVAWRMSGGWTISADFGLDQGGRLYATGSRRYLVSGMPAGASVTITPVYRLSNVPNYGSGESASFHHGNLIVEPV